MKHMMEFEKWNRRFSVQNIYYNCVQQLEYGGDEHWPFIEVASYSEFIAALLRDVDGDNQEEVAENGNTNMQDQNPLRASPVGQKTHLRLIIELQKTCKTKDLQKIWWKLQSLYSMF